MSDNAFGWLVMAVLVGSGWVTGTFIVPKLSNRWLWISLGVAVELAIVALVWLSRFR